MNQSQRRVVYRSLLVLAVVSFVIAQDACQRVNGLHSIPSDKRLLVEIQTGERTSHLELRFWWALAFSVASLVAGLYIRAGRKL